MKIKFYSSNFIAFLLFAFCFLGSALKSVAQQPLNDACNSAIDIAIPNSGYATGLFTSDTVDISNATIQTGETFPPSIFVGGLHQKSIWFKFTISTSRQLEITLIQPGVAITSGNVGFSVYKTNNCVPGSSELSLKLTPIETFGSTFHPCVDSGTYYIQVSSKINANGPIFLQLNVEPVTSPYDDHTTAYSFGVMNQPRKQVTYDMDCYSKEDAAEVCTGVLPNENQYTKTSWHTFTTPGYFDHLTFLIAAGTTPYFTTSATQHIIGYKLYRGNAATSAISSLILVDGCDSVKTNGYNPGYRGYKCGTLDSNTTYSLQLFFRSDFNASVKVGLFCDGIAPSKAPTATANQMQADNILGTLAPGTISRTDRFACNSRHSTNPCGNTKTVNGVMRFGTLYNLSTYYSFSLSQAGNVTFTSTDLPNTASCKPRYFRLFSSGISNNCTTLDTLSYYEDFYNDTLLKCLPAGNYALQVMGSDALLSTLSTNDVINSTISSCIFSNFGQGFNISFNFEPVLDGNNYSLFQQGAYDRINNMLPLQPNTTYYSNKDTFGCANAVKPGIFNCSASHKKAMYREFVLTDSVSISLGQLNLPIIIGNQAHYFQYQLFKNDANALVTAQNVWGYPDTFSGATPITNNCVTYNGFGYNQICLVPDTYTLATYGSEYLINKVDSPSISVYNYTTLHYSQSTVGNMGSVLDTINNPLGGSYTSDIDRFSCKNNAITIDGVAPCGTKAIYREFYLSQPANLQISTSTITFAVFSGRLSVVGFNGLTNVIPCSSLYTSPCQTLPAGWYTVVCYTTASSYSTPMGNIYGGYLGINNTVTITQHPACAQPLFNRPYKAAINTTTNTPFVLTWNTAAAANAYPATGVLYNLPNENWNCVPDTPFSNQPATSCNPFDNRIAYYVFTLTQESYLAISGGVYANMRLYKRDVRTDSLLFPTLTPIHPCNSNSDFRMEICKAQPGTYTLVLTGNIQCVTFFPQIYVDQPGTSRFDHAARAYDFGTVPTNGLFHNGKLGEVNPLHPGRAPSNDFFYCTTGARTTDPAGSGCGTLYNASIYNQPDTNNVISTISYAGSRRNLWYTFQLTKPGTVKVKVDNKTVGKAAQYTFAVYRSDVNGSLPFTQVVSSGSVDSTILQGLTLVKNNGPYTLCEGSNTITFDVPPCNFDTIRYYVVVDTRYTGGNSMRPNHQAEVSISVDTVPSVYTSHDYYITAFDMDTLATGLHTGATDYYTCATANSSYPTGLPACAERTLWYKFTVDTSVIGTAKIRLKINGTTNAFAASDFVLYKEIAVGDSTASGLISVPLSDIAGYRQACVSFGAYYLVPTGCNKTNESVYPEILIESNVGDYCSAPLVATISGPGTASATALIDCHTIGTDYGELNTTLTCPTNALTDDYKSTWFRLDIAGSDTLDLTLSLAENTNASSSQIHYRMMTGNCNAMQEQSCVLDAQTQNTYQCMVPGNSYYLQVFTPKNYFSNNPAFPTLGTVTLNVSAVDHIDTCSPMVNCLVNANFIPEFNCNLNDSAIFNNYSTYGTAMTYLWDFGYNNQTSTSFSPRFRYPALMTAATYTVSLRVINNDCNDTAYSIQTITIPPRPSANLGNDTSTCTNGDTITLHSPSYPGSSYLWQDNSTDSVFHASMTGWNTYHVAVTYAGCTSSDSISVYISPLVPQYDTLLICDNMTMVDMVATRPYSGTTYSWFDLTATSVLTVNTPGVYWANVTLNGCTVRDTFVVQYNQDTLSILGDDTAICHFANGYILNAATTGASAYLWQDNSTANSYTVTAPGNYWVQVDYNGCAYTDSIAITSLALDTASNADTVCFGMPYILPGGDTVYSGGLYQDTVATNAGCDSVIKTTLVYRDSIAVLVYDTVCSNMLPITWNGIPVASGGANAASFTAPNIYGCDSTTWLQLQVNPTDSTILNDQICLYALPYNFLGTNLTASGTYLDTLTNINGCDSFVVLNLQVLLEYRDTLNQELCTGGSYTFYDSVYNQTGYYTKLFSSTSGCDSIKILNLLVHPPTPPPAVVSPVGYCLNETAVPLTAGGTQILWYTSAQGGVGSSVPPTPNTSATGSTTYYLSQTINNCESERDSIVVNVSERPVADFTAVPDQDLCTGDTVVVTFTGTQPANSVQVWNWDGAFVDGTDPGPYRVSWSTGGIKTIQLWVDNDGCISDTAEHEIVIKQGPETPSIELPESVCVGDTIVIIGQPESSGALFQWTYDQTQIQQGSSFPVSWKAQGVHSFSLSLLLNGCESAPAFDTIIVHPKPELSISTENTKLCIGSTIELDAIPVSTTTQYVWSPTSYFPDGNNEGSGVKATLHAAGTIFVTAINEFNCTNIDSIFVNAQVCCDIFIPNAFSPNGDGKNDIFKLMTEPGQEIKEFAIFNRFGERVFMTKNNTNGWDGLHRGNPSDLGVYNFYVKYTCGDGNEYFKKGVLHLIR